MNEIAELDKELNNLANEAMRGGGFQKMLKFKKGDYVCDGREVERGTQFIAHTVGWVKQWVKFVDRKPAERKTYRVIRGEYAPERDEMPDNDEEARKKWPPGLDGKPADPWVLQYLLPLEDPETGEGHLFVTSSAGGKRAIEELVGDYARKRKRDKTLGQPLIRIQKTMMPTSSFGPVPRPLFEVVSYETTAAPVRDVSAEAIKAAEDDAMDDEIPF